MSLTAIPTLRSSLPADGGTVGNSADLFLYFSEAVKAGTGTVRLYKSNGTLVETFNTSSGEGDNGGKISFNSKDVNVVLKPGSTQVRIVTDGDEDAGLDRTYDLGASGAKPEGGLAEFSRSTVRINPGANLDVTANYYLQIDNGAILDYSDDPYAGISNTTSLNFTTGNAAPRLLQSWPADQSWFNSASNLHFHFSEDVFAGPNSGTSTFNLYKGDGTLIESFNTATGLGSGEGSIEIFGSDVMIDPGSDLLDGADYYLQIGTTALKDSANLNYAGINDTTTLNFKAFDFVPELTGTNFSDDELDFKTDIELYFNEPVYAVGYGEDSISLYNSSDDSLVESFNPGTGIGDMGGSIEIDGNRITIDPGPDLEAGNSYYLQLESDSLQDSTSQYFAGISDTTTLEFLAIDLPPELTGTSPNDNGVIDITHDIQLYFTEEVFSGSGNLGLYKSTDDSLVENFNVANASEGGAIEFIDNRVVLRPSANLLPGVSYYVKVGPEAVVDDGDQDFAGINDKTTFNFTASDLAPTLVHSSPNDNGEHEFSNDIYLNFSEPVVAQSGTVKLYIAGSNILVETFNVATGVGDMGGSLGNIGGSLVDNGSSSVWIDPYDDLAIGEDYYLKVSTGAFEDATGNPYAGINDTTTLNFTTVDNAPALHHTLPAVGSQWDKNSSLQLWFSEAIFIGEGSIRLYRDVVEPELIETFSYSGEDYSGDDGGHFSIFGHHLRLTPGSELEIGDEYFLQIDGDAIVDSTGNYLPGVFTSSLHYTAYDGPPSVDFVIWPNTVTTDIVVVFTEALYAGTGTVRLYRSSDNALIETFDMGTLEGDDEGSIVIDGSDLILSPGSDLQLGTSYYLAIDATALKDENDQFYPGTAFMNDIFFQVNDQAPMLDHTFPADGGTLFAGESLELYFTEDVLFGDEGEIKLYKAGGVLVETFDTGTESGSAGGTLSILGSKVTIDPDEDLESGTDYYLWISGDAILDDSGQYFSGISDDTTLDFSVPENMLTLQSSNPADDGEVDKDADLFLNFSAAVIPGTGSIHLYKEGEGGSPVLEQSFEVSDAGWGEEIEFSGSTVILRPLYELGIGHDYWIEIDPTAVKTEDDLYFAGIDDDTTLNFIPVDMAPSLTFTQPEDGGTHEAGNNLFLHFSEQVWAGSGDNVFVELYEQGGALVESFNVALNSGSNEGSMQFSEGRMYVEFNPGDSLVPGTSYYVLIGDQAFKDDEDQYFAGISSPTALNFTAVDEDPVLLASSADEPYIHPYGFFWMYFSEAVVLGDGDIRLYDSNDVLIETFTGGAGNALGEIDLYGSALAIQPGSTLMPGEYYIEVDNDAVEDSTGNLYPGEDGMETLNFTVSDDFPELYSTEPDDGGTVYLTDDLYVYFTENVYLGSGMIGLYLGESGTLVEEFDASTGLGTMGGSLYAGEGTGLRIDPGDDLVDGEEYYLLIEQGAVEDSFDQPFAGLDSPTDLNFTAYNPAPEIYYSSPSDGGIYEDADPISITFTEDVSAGSGYVWLYDADDNLIEKFDVATGDGTQGGDLTIMYGTVEVDPGVMLIDAEDYYLQIDATAFVDSLGKAYAGIANETTLNFTVMDDPPALVSTNVDGGDLEISANIVLTFSEDIEGHDNGLKIRLFQSNDPDPSTEIMTFEWNGSWSQTGGTISIAGNVLTIDPDSPLADDEVFYLLIDDGALADATDNHFVGIIGITDLDFITYTNPI